MSAIRSVAALRTRMLSSGHGIHGRCRIAASSVAQRSPLRAAVPRKAANSESKHISQSWSATQQATAQSLSRGPAGDRKLDRFSHEMRERQALLLRKGLPARALEARDADRQVRRVGFTRRAPRDSGAATRPSRRSGDRRGSPPSCVLEPASRWPTRSVATKARASSARGEQRADRRPTCERLSHARQPIEALQVVPAGERVRHLATA